MKSEWGIVYIDSSQRETKYFSSRWSGRKSSSGRKSTFFNTCMKKAFFLRRKVNRKSNFSSVCRGLAQQREEKYFVSRCDESIYTIPHSLFMQKKVLFLHLLKKLLCVTREQLTFSDSDDDFEHS